MTREATVADESGRVVFAYENIGKLAVSATIWSTVQAVWLYVRARQADPSKVVLSVVGNSGNTLYDFVLGHELNPRLQLTPSFELDLKYFNELRPGITGWAMINLAYALRFLQDRQGEQGSLLAALPALPLEFLLLLTFQLWYAYDALACEASILSTVDIVTDGFGWMLSFGDLVWVPFVFSLQARYLAFHPLHMSPLHVAAVAAVAVTGSYIFRSSNSQKDTFRRNPEDPAVRHLQYISTKRGTRLLADGWWGVARHVNYLGDWLLGLSWCLTTGANSLFTYVYVIYFAVLLIHRERRDDAECLAKYGDDWREYRRRVPFRIIPYVY
jgi:delta14-sterol reductase